MSFFAVRDDDTSYYTSIDDLEYAYAKYWGKVPISLAVVPLSVDKHRDGKVFSKNNNEHDYAPISDNIELVKYLKDKVAAGHIEIMLHGSTHEFKFVNKNFISECIWKDAEELLVDIRRDKRYLENLFNTQIRTYVPPANDISVDGINAVRDSGLFLSGMMGKWGDRPISINYVNAWIKRWGWRLLKGYPYPFALSYDGHKELYAHALNPFVSESKIITDLRKSVDNKASFVAATHYWAFQDSEKTGQLLKNCIDEAERQNMRFATVSECILGIKDED